MPVAEREVERSDNKGQIRARKCEKSKMQGLQGKYNHSGCYTKVAVKGAGISRSILRRDGSPREGLHRLDGDGGSRRSKEDTPKGNTGA